MSEPTFDPSTSTISIPETRVHKIKGRVVHGDVHITGPTTVTVEASQGRVLPKDAVTSFVFDPNDTDDVPTEFNTKPDEFVELTTPKDWASGTDI